MSDFRKCAQLQEQLGPDRWNALIDSGNTGKVKDFCDGLVAAALPTTMTLGGGEYDILSFLRGEKSVKGDVMVAHAKEMNAHQGKKEREHLLNHQDEIPAILQGNVVFVFTDDTRPGDPEDIAIVRWGGDRWVQRWHWLVLVWSGDYRVLRRKSK